MRIGVDASSLSRPLNGISRYTLEICRAITINPTFSLFLYSSDRIAAYASGLEKATIRNKHWSSAIARQCWFETCLPTWIKQDNIDVFWQPTHRLPRWLPKQVARVVTIHDLVWKYAPQSMRWSRRLSEAFQMPFSLRAADNIVTDSQATANALVKEFNIALTKLAVVPLAARVKQSTETSDPAKLVKKPYFLFVGTHEPRKNLLRLIQAYARLPSTLKDNVRFIIAGGKGWGRINIAEAIEAHALTDHVKILGYVDELTLSTLYANCLFLVMPSLYEGFGLPIVEAMSHGKPILTSNNSSMPEVAGDAGLLVDPFSTDSIYTGLEKMIADDKLRNTLASKAKKNAARFDWHTSVEKLLNVFNSAITARRGSLL